MSFETDDQFKYLPYIIPFVIVQILILIGICIYIKPRFRKDEYDIQDSFLTIHKGNSIWISTALCIERLAFFGFYLYFIINAASTDKHEWYYFSYWNIWLTFAYFTLASAATVVSLIYFRHLPKPGSLTVPGSTVRDNNTAMHAGGVDMHFPTNLFITPQPGKIMLNSSRPRPLSLTGNNRLSLKDIYRQFNKNGMIDKGGMGGDMEHTSDLISPDGESLDTEQFQPDGSILNKDYRWIENIYMYYLCVIVHILFEFLGASSFLVTVLALTLIDSNIKNTNNFEMHVVTSISFAIEMMMSRMTVYIDHYRYMAYWFLIYTIVIWSTTYTNATNLNYNFPYDFLNTDTTSSFIWYEIIIIASLIFYGLWILLSQIKYKYIISKQSNE